MNKYSTNIYKVANSHMQFNVASGGRQASMSARSEMESWPWHVSCDPGQLT